MHLRIEALLDELEPHMQRLRPNFAKRASGLTANWVYRHWSTGGVLVGFGMSPAGLVGPLPDDPVVFAFVGNEALEEHDALAAVGVDAISRSTWLRNDPLDAHCGLIWSWPALARRATDVLTAESFDEQVGEAMAFVRKTIEFYRGRGFLRNEL